MWRQKRKKGAAATTHLIGRPDTGVGVGHVCFSEVEEAASLLADLVALRRYGDCLPLPFFPKSSRAYATFLKGSDEPQRVRAARLNAYEIFRSQEARGERGVGEIEDLYMGRLFAEEDPLAPSWVSPDDDASIHFALVSRRVFEPLLAHREVLL